MSIVDIPTEVWDHQLAAINPAPVDWLWQGFVACSNITLLTSQWKAGKTTLLSLLLARRNRGGDLAGLAVKPGKSLVVSEEPASLWTTRACQLDFGGQVCFLHQPFLSLPRPDQWQALLDRMLALKEAHGIDLAVIDPLAPFLRGENNAKGMLESLLPLGALTRRAMAVLLLHHPGKGDRPMGQAARGSGALLGHVDISIEMRHPGGDPLTRRRRFLALSRHAATPRQLLLELNADGTDYVPAADADEDDLQSRWEPLRLILMDAPQKLTRDDILAEWPPDSDAPKATSLWRLLRRAVERGLIACEGAGRRSDPFRYWLPEREAVWRQHPLYDLLEQHARTLNLPFESLQEHERKLRQARDE
jgi:AAA domain